MDRNSGNAVCRTGIFKKFTIVSIHFRTHFVYSTKDKKEKKLEGKSEYFALGQKQSSVVVHICKRKSSNLRTIEALRTNKRGMASIQILEDNIHTSINDDSEFKIQYAK